MKRIRRSPKQRASLFLEIRPNSRMVLTGVALISLLWEVVKFMLSSTPASQSAALAGIVYGLLVLAPIFFYRPSYGWFHPLIFSAVKFLIVNLLVLLPNILTLFNNGPSAIVYSLKSHDALPGWNPESLTQLIAYESLLGSLGLVAYYFGFFCGLTPKPPRVDFRFPFKISRKVLLFIVFTVAIFAVYIYSKGGIVQYLLSWAELGRRGAIGGYGPVLVLMSTASLLCLIWFALDRKVYLKPLFWLASGAALTMNFLTTGSRSSVIYPIILGLLLWILRERKIPSTRILIFLIVCILLLGILGNFRRSLTFRGELDWSLLTNVPAAIEATLGTEEKAGELAVRSGSRKGSLPILALVPDRVDLLYGKSYLPILTVFIPRALFPEKPRAGDVLVAQTFFNVPGGIPPGAVAEAYWNFHIPGVILVFFLFGIFHKWLVKGFLRYAHQPAASILYLITLFQVVPSSTPIVKWLLTILPVLVIMYLFRVLSLHSRST